jgi:hypothetical protein
MSEASCARLGQLHRFGVLLVERTGPVRAANRASRSGLVLTGLGTLHGTTAMFRISQDRQEPIVDVEFEEDIEPAVRSYKPGRYYVDEIRGHDDPLP